MMSDSTTSTDQTSGLLDRPQQAPLRFAFVGGPRDGQVIRINASKCSIGSSEQASFRLVCKGVHPVHCTILRGLGGTVVKRISADTFINGDTFEEAMLNDGDVLTIGPLRFRVLSELGTAIPTPTVSPTPAASPQPAQATAPAAAEQPSVEELQQRLQELEAERERERLELEAQQREADAAEAQQSQESEQQAADTNDAPVADAFDRSSAMDMLNQLRDEPVAEANGFEATPEASDSSEADYNSESPESFESSEASADYSTPQSEEELTFSEPDDSAPIDTAAILAKFGHSLEDDDDGTQTAFMNEPSAPANNYADATPAFDSAGSYGGEPESAPEGEDESIDDYMAQLMARVGGGAGEPEAPKTPKPAASKPKPAPAAQPQPPRAERRVPLDPSEFVPRAVAPEASSNLRALRAVANTSARSAIDRHQRRSFDNKAYICWFIAIVSAIVCFSMAFFANEIVSLPTLVSMLALMISFFATINGLAFAAKAKVGLRATQQQLLANLDSSESPQRP